MTMAMRIPHGRPLVFPRDGHENSPRQDNKYVEGRLHRQEHALVSVQGERLVVRGSSLLEMLCGGGGIGKKVNGSNGVVEWN